MKQNFKKSRHAEGERTTLTAAEQEQRQGQLLRRRQRQQSEIAEQCAGGEISKKTHTERNIHLQRTAVEREEILQRRRETMTAPQLETRIAEVETRTGEVETVRDTNIAN